jgi:hypothetical protein
MNENTIDETYVHFTEMGFISVHKTNKQIECNKM